MLHVRADAIHFSGAICSRILPSTSQIQDLALILRWSAQIPYAPMTTHAASEFDSDILTEGAVLSI